MELVNEIPEHNEGEIENKAPTSMLMADPDTLPHNVVSQCEEEKEGKTRDSLDGLKSNIASSTNA